MADVVLEVEKLCKTFPASGTGEAIAALQDISFSLKAGEVCGIIGRNGAGKSTLLKILSEVTTPSSGQIRYKGRYSSILNIGAGFHPDLSGRENIYMKGQLLGMSRKEVARKFDEIVAFSGVEEFLGRQVKHYSNGMYLRLAFSVAFHSPAALLYLDEVLSVGDAEFRIKSHAKVKEVIAQGATVVMVSHYLGEITDLCNQVAFLDQGRLRMFGPTLPIVETYMEEVLSERAAGFSAPDSEVFRLDRVQVSARDKAPGAPILMSDAIEICIAGEKFQAGFSLEFVLFLVDVNGVQILTDSYGVQPGFRPQLMASGKFEVRAYIPAPFLNRGVFRLHLAVCRDRKTTLCHIHDVVAFQVKSDPEEGALYRINSILKMPLKWEFQQD